jgi:hypothetical protein
VADEKMPNGRTKWSAMAKWREMAWWKGARLANTRTILSRAMYNELTECLAKKGIFSFFQKPEQLVVSLAFPHLPENNSFWVTHYQSVWYLCTWLPEMYRVPVNQDMCEVCAGILSSSKEAIYRVDDACIVKYQLDHLKPEEADILLAEIFKNQNTEQ